MRPDKLSGKQQGVAILLFLLILFVSGSAAVITAMNYSSRNTDMGRLLVEHEDTDIRLEIAKSALFLYAMRSAENFPGTGPWRFPCPDLNSDGLPENSCNTANLAFGRLPKSATLASGATFDFVDAYLEPDAIRHLELWYAVTPAFSSASTSLTTAAGGNFTVNGESDVVAVILAPGSPVSGQTRPSNSAGDYLEGGNENIANNNFNNAGSVDIDSFNDRLITISRAEFIDNLALRSATVIKTQLDNYYAAPTPIRNFVDNCSVTNTNTYPRGNTRVLFAFGWLCAWGTEQQMFLQAMQGAPAWHQNNGWNAVSNYTLESNTRARIQFTGCATVFTLRHANDPDYASYGSIHIQETAAGTPVPCLP